MEVVAMLKNLKLFQGLRPAAGAPAPHPARSADTARERGPAVAPVPALKRYLTHQPVLDADCRLVGYDLGLRERVPIPVIPGAADLAQMKDELLLVSVIDLAYQQALGDRLTFLRLRPETLRNPLVDLLPAGKVILTIPATAATADLTERCADLAGLGIPLALDGQVTQSSAPLLAHCRYARLSIGDTDILSLGDRLGHLQAFGTPRLIVDHVDSEEAFEACQLLAFELFQGDFLNRPRGLGEHRVDAQRLRVMELLNQVMREADTPRLAETLKQDAGLTYRLLRYINAPVNGLSQAIQSMEQALMWLGRDQLYRWLTLLLFSSGQPDGRSQALLRNALVRARFMEKLGADRFSPPMRGGLFIVGVLSQLDALLDLPMAQALEPLHLAPDITDALLNGRGLYAPYLRLALACERLDLDTVERMAAEYRLEADEVNLAHIDALIWAERLKD
jgi:EAL and modified HD-GYP domain-containing signal transduction protein